MHGLLRSTYEEDFAPGKGQLLPPGTYRVMVEEAGEEATAKGDTQCVRRYGSVRTREGGEEFLLPNGARMRIGGRKIFVRSWTKHSNPQAEAIGHRELKREAAAAGLMERPVKGGPAVELDFPSWPAYCAQLVGKEFLVHVKHRPKFTRVGAELVRAENEDGSPAFDVEVDDWMSL